MFDVFQLVMAGKWTIALSVILVSLVGGLYVLLVPPTYEADGLVQVEQNDKTGSMSQLSDISSLLLGSPVETEAEIQLLQSRMILNAVVDEMGLLVEARPKHFPLIGYPITRLKEHLADDLSKPLPALLGMSSYAWGGEIIDVQTFEVPEKLIDEKLELRTTKDGYALFDLDKKKLLEGKVGELATAATDGGAIKILVRQLQARPDTRFKITRRTRQEVIQKLLDHLDVTEQGKQSGVIQINFTGPSAEFVTKVVDNIEDAYLAQNVERRSADAKQSLEFLEQQLPELKKKVDESQAQLNVYQVGHGSVDVSQETELILQQSVDLETQRLQLVTQRDEALQRFTPRHPVVLALNKQIATVEEAQGKLHLQETKLPKTQQEVFGFMRDVNVATDLYSEMLHTIQELQVTKAGTIGNVRIVDPAQHPDEAARPKVPQVMAVAFFLGGFVGVGIVLIRRVMLRGVDDPAEVERQLGVTTYAMIPFAPEQRRLGRMMARGEPGEPILAIANPTSPAVEAIRSLRTSLHFALLESTNNVIMLTGPTPNLGKSFLSMNLGAILAISGKRVIVIDADLRRGTLHKYIKSQSSPGLADFVAGECGKQALVRQTTVKNLDFISHGTTPPNPAELLLHDRFGELIAELSKEYDYVIIDAPPILMVTDPAILGRHAGCTLLVLKSAEHPMREIAESVRRLANSGVRVRGTLFNQMGATAGSYGYGGYGGYGYGSRYYRYDNKT